MIYDAIVVGGGIAGLTAAAYLSRSGASVLLCEKEDQLGGLVSSFQYKGFTFDGGIRALENSGIVMPMLRQLGIEIEFIKSTVSIGIEQDIVRVQSPENLEDYQQLLNKHFPDNQNDIHRIIRDIRRIMDYMDILYGIDNPLFLDMTRDRDYFIRTILPWMFKYIFTINKIQKLSTPVVEYLERFTDNGVLIDMIAQHFFQETPAFFALSYFSLYLDYQYPRGGTGTFVRKMEEFIRAHQGEILTDCRICSLDPQTRQLQDSQGRSFLYRKMIWAADLKELYRITDTHGLIETSAGQAIRKQKEAVMDKSGADSVLTMYMTVDMDKQYFENICSAHFFYTPYKEGLSSLDSSRLHTDGNVNLKDDKEAILAWLKQFYHLTTYEISFPVMRDDDLAPPGKTGLIISTLFDYALTKQIDRLGWYEEFKDFSAATITDILMDTIFPAAKERIMDRFVSTPLTMETKTGNTDGAITGWAFTNRTIPVVSKLTQIARSVLTPIPDTYQAGQWTYSPSGLPISVLTGKLAADRVLKNIK